MHMRKSRFSSFAVGTLVAVLAACAGEQVVQGECQSVFDGDVCTWGTMVGDDIVAFGATVALASVENAPSEGEMVFPPPFVGIIALPDEVATATGFDHLGMNWEPHGHPPSLFLTPFYTVDPDRVQAIDCSDVSKPTDIPAAYTLPDLEIPGLGELVGLCVPTMGMHAMLEAEVDATEPFGASMILGYYKRNLIFLEPMISQSKLLGAQSFTMDIPAVQDPGANVQWPTSFEAVYDEASRTYRFVFSGFQRHS
jgi:hypothetical protein